MSVCYRHICSPIRLYSQKFPVFSLFNRESGLPEPENGSLRTASTAYTSCANRPSSCPPRATALPAHGPPRAMRGLAPPAGGRQGAFRAGGRWSGPGDRGLRDDPDTLERPARIPEDAVTMPLPARFFASEPSVLVHGCRPLIHPTAPQGGATLRSRLNHPF